MIRRIVGAAAALLVTIGCAHGTPGRAERLGDLSARLRDDAMRDGRTDLVAALADDVVTAAEYDGLVASYIECVEATGATTDAPVPNPANPRITIVWTSDVGPDPAAYDKAYEQCERRYLSVEELLWEDPGRMDARVRERTASCMETQEHPIGAHDDDLRDMTR